MDGFYKMISNISNIELIDKNKVYILEYIYLKNVI